MVDFRVRAQKVDSRILARDGLSRPGVCGWSLMFGSCWWILASGLLQVDSRVRAFDVHGLPCSGFCGLLTQERAV